MTFHEFLGQLVPASASRTYNGVLVSAVNDASGNTYVVGKADSNGNLPSFRGQTNCTLYKLNSSGVCQNGIGFNPPSALTSANYVDLAYDSTNNRLALRFFSPASPVVISSQSYYAVVEINPSTGALIDGLTSNITAMSYGAGGVYQRQGPSGELAQYFKSIFYLSGQLYAVATSGSVTQDYYPLTVSSNTLTTTTPLFTNPLGGSPAATYVTQQDISGTVSAINPSQLRAGTVSPSGTLTYQVITGSSQVQRDVSCASNSEFDTVGLAYGYASGLYDQNNTVLRYDLSGGAYSVSSVIGNSTGSGAAFNCGSSTGFWANSSYLYYGVCKLSDNSAVYYSSNGASPTYKGSSLSGLVATNLITKVDGSGNIATWSLPTAFSYVNSLDCISCQRVIMSMYRKSSPTDHIVFLGVSYGTGVGGSFMFETDSSGNVVWA